MHWKPAWLIFLTVGVLTLPARTEAQGKVAASRFLEMPTEDQILYTDGVLDTLVALAAEKLIPKEIAACSRNISYGEIISEVKSYLYKGLSSEDRGVKEAMKITPVSVWIVRSYGAKCEGRQR